MFQGQKVILRPGKEEDIPRQFEFAQNPQLYGLDCSYPIPISLARTRALFESRNRAEGEDKENIFFAIEADGKYIGDCCLMHVHDRYGNMELGIMIGDPEYWGRGYGRDAVRLLLDFGFCYLGARRIVLTTHARNERAIRCYRACGFIEEGRPRKVLWIEGEYVDLVNMSILRDEWQALKETQAGADKA